MGVLRYNADIRTIAFIAGYFALLALVWTYQPTGWMNIAAVAVLCYASFTCAVITHNTIHTPIFTVRPLNRLMQFALSLAYGHPVSAYVPGHNLSHHMHTQTARDVMRTTKLRFRWNLLNQLLFLPMVAGSISRADWQYTTTMYKHRPAWFAQWLAEWAVLAAVGITLLVLDWQSFLLYFALPHAYAAWGIVGINYAQHDGCDETHPYNHSRNFVSPWLNWWLFNNGYHGIHHLQPNLHWSLLPEAHGRLFQPHVHPNLDQASMFLYFWRTHIWPGKRLDYLGNPVLLPALEDDAPWVPHPDEHPAEASLGAMGG
jgi:fatty acid desaturase